MSKLRELQLKELEILKAVTDICHEEGITYFLNSGTLLGAVRHGGFIPWDDDVDICMPYEDYKRFLACSQEKLGENCFVQNMETEPNYNHSYTRVHLNGTTCMDSYQTSWDIHHCICIDVFPIVPLRGKLDFKLTRIVLSFCNFFQLDYGLQYYFDEYQKLLGRFGIVVLRLFYKIPQAKRIKWHKAIVDRICSRKNRSCCSVLWGNITTFYPENVFTEQSTILFEGIPFSAPKDTDKYLRYTYGDYMQLPPEEKRRSHPFDIIDFDNDYHKYMRI